MKLTSGFGRSRREGEARRRGLLRGEAVTILCPLRRTSARGWGPWTDAEVVLGELPDGVVAWHVDDPIAVGLPSVHGPVDATLDGVTEVWTRPVRFETEAFWGMDASIVVVQADRGTVELACDPAIVDLVATRVRDLAAAH